MAKISTSAVRKPALGRPADSRITAEFIASDPRFSGVSPFDPATDIDIVDEINAALNVAQGALSDGLTVTGDGVTSPLSTPGYDAWIGRFWRRVAGQEAVLDNTLHPDRFVKLAALDLTNYTVGGISDGFNARFEGIVTPRFNEVYTLNYTADDGIRIWIDDVLAVDGWRNAAPQANSGSVNLGLLTIDRPYRMRVEWYQIAVGVGANQNPNHLYVSWQSASQVEQAIPTIGYGVAVNTFVVTDNTLTGDGATRKLGVAGLGKANGIATLGSDGKVTAAQLPSMSSLPAGGAAGQILTKSSATDGDASWKDAPVGGSSTVATDNDTITGNGKDAALAVGPAVLGRITALEQLNGTAQGVVTITDDFAGGALNRIWQTNLDPLPDVTTGKAYSADGSARSAVILDAMGDVTLTASMAPGAILLLRCLGRSRYELLYNPSGKLELYYGGVLQTTFGSLTTEFQTLTAQVTKNILTVLVNNIQLGNAYQLNGSSGSSGFSIKDRGSITSVSVTFNKDDQLSPSVAQSVDGIPPHSWGLLDDGTNPPRLVRKRADGTVWYGAVFSNTP